MIGGRVALIAGRRPVRFPGTRHPDDRGNQKGDEWGPTQDARLHLFPVDGAGGLGRDVVDHAVDRPHLVHAGSASRARAFRIVRPTIFPARVRTIISSSEMSASSAACGSPNELKRTSPSG